MSDEQVDWKTYDGPVRITAPRTVKGGGKTYIIRDCWTAKDRVAYCEYAKPEGSGAVSWHRCPEASNFADIEPFEG